jgi:hypothetical protein
MNWIHLRKQFRSGRVLGLAALVVVAAASVFTLRDDSRVQASAASPSPAAAATADSGLKVVAYYFHVTVRCVTCRTIESYSREAIEQGFANELKSGRLEWKPVNIQLPENQHFVRDYQLFTRSLVLVKMRGGKQVEYRNLEKIWDLVGNKAEFEKYVQSNVKGYLGEG